MVSGMMNDSYWDIKARNAKLAKANRVPIHIEEAQRMRTIFVRDANTISSGVQPMPETAKAPNTRRKIVSKGELKVKDANGKLVKARNRKTLVTGRNSTIESFDVQAVEAHRALEFGT